jgi:uncharacterized protein (DUF362 family)
LTHTLGTAAWISTGGLKTAWAEETERGRPQRPDRSGEAPSVPVAIGRCESYEPQLVRRRLDEAIGLLGGLGKLVQNKTVTIKLNLTGGAHQLGGLPAHRTYHVHPNLVAALCALLHDAGAKRMVVVESQYTRKAPEEVLTAAGWDVKAIQSAGGQKVSFEDTRSRGNWAKYSRLEVPWGGFIFPAFDVNPCYDKTDVFISLAKMKDHANAGITLGVKNLFGIAPTSLYGDDAPNEDSVSNRGATFHQGSRAVPDGVPKELDHGLPKHWSCRVPRITADTFGARPVDLTLIDGVETNRGGEGPWIKGVQPVQPKLLLLGRNAVCTDAVAAAVMGYDPTADHKTFPFMGENHLKLLASVGVGTNDPERIEVRGLAVKEALYPFNPKRLEVGVPLFS